MSTLGLENLAPVLQGETSRAAGAGGEFASEASALRAMRSEGMEPPGGFAVGAGGEASTAGDNAKTFSEMLRNSFDQVNQDQHEADRAIKEMVAGRNKNIHETMLTIERADTSLKLALQVRNKILDAYREIMRMQV